MSQEKKKKKRCFLSVSFFVLLLNILFFVLLAPYQGLAQGICLEKGQNRNFDSFLISDASLYDDFDENIYDQVSESGKKAENAKEFGADAKSGIALSEPLEQKTSTANPPILDEAGTQNTQELEYRMTDKKHALFRKENKDYALADAMLNLTWNAIKKQSNKEEFAQKLKEQRLWLDYKRDAVASSFSMNLSEVNAFTLAFIARTQELAAQVFLTPQSGDVYLFSPTNAKKAQGGHIVVNSKGTTHTIQGQSFAKNGNTCEIEGQGVLSAQGWATFTTKKKENFFVLFTKDTAYIVHEKIALCGKGVSFQGTYTHK